MKKIKNILSKTSTFLYSFFYQKKYKCGHVVISYILKRDKKSKDLIIVFPAVTKRPFFNYVKTLRNSKSNVLFLKDNFGKERIGTYMLGERGSTQILLVLDELIQHIKDKRIINNIFAIGSSKGGTIAIFWSKISKHNIKSLIVGSPQYHLGNYLYYHGGGYLLKNIMNGNTSADALELDSQCERIVLTGGGRTNVYFYTSSNEDDFHKKESEKLIADLIKTGCTVNVIDGKYVSHSGLAESYKRFLKEKMTEFGI